MNLMNLVCIGESEDCRGNITRILVESDYAKEYRIKKAEQQKRWYEKKKASQPLKEKKPPMTKEERSRRVMAYQKTLCRWMSLFGRFPVTTALAYGFPEKWAVSIMMTVSCLTDR